MPNPMTDVGGLFVGVVEAYVVLVGTNASLLGHIWWGTRVPVGRYVIQQHKYQLH